MLLFFYIFPPFLSTFYLQIMSEWGHNPIVNPYAEDPIISDSQTFSDYEVSQGSIRSNYGKEKEDSPEEILSCFCGNCPPAGSLPDKEGHSICCSAIGRSRTEISDNGKNKLCSAEDRLRICICGTQRLVQSNSFCCQLNMMLLYGEGKGRMKVR